MDGLRAGRDAYLVAGAVVSDHGAGGVSAVAVAIAGGGRIGAGGIPPVVVVIGGRPIPAAILIDQRWVIPVQTGVVTGQHDPLTGMAQGPHVVCIDEGDVRFHCQNLALRLGGDRRLLELIDVVGGDPGHVRARGNRPEEDLIPATDKDLVGDEKRLIVRTLPVEKLAQGPLGALGRAAQGLQDKAPLSLSGTQSASPAQICFLLKPHKEIGLTLGGNLIKHGRLDLVGRLAPGDGLLRPIAVLSGFQSGLNWGGVSCPNRRQQQSEDNDQVGQSMGAHLQNPLPESRSRAVGRHSILMAKACAAVATASHSSRGRPTRLVVGRIRWADNA